SASANSRGRRIWPGGSSTSSSRAPTSSAAGPNPGGREAPPWRKPTGLGEGGVGSRLAKPPSESVHFPQVVRQPTTPGPYSRALFLQFCPGLLISISSTFHHLSGNVCLAAEGMEEGHCPVYSLPLDCFHGNPLPLQIAGAVPSPSKDTRCPRCSWKSRF